jgi:signal transduction histidine kinase
MSKTEAEIRNILSKELKKGKLDYQKFLELSNDLSKFDKENFHFSIDAGTLINLGRDSIKDHTTALVELVKNSYDADATRIEIDIFNAIGKNGYIRIADNGDGMTQEEVVSDWLRIGYSAKRKKKTSRKKRRKTGEKGIGRLSADRLGSTLSLITKAATGRVFGLDVNWESFNSQGIDLNIIPLKSLKNPKITIPQFKKNGPVSQTGTELIIKTLRNSWADTDMKNLWEELAVLTPPFKKIKDFEIWINTDIETEYKGRVEPQVQTAAEVSLNLKYDGKSNSIGYSITNKYKLIEEKKAKISWTSLIQKGLKDIKKIPLRNKLSCGPVELQILFYPREAAMIEGTGFKLGQLQEYLDKNNGIKIYRDNVSVKPYGFANVEGSDWLDLSLRQGQNPAGIGRPDWMVKPNQLIGAAFIHRDQNPQLKDSAAREGLIHEDSFFDLRALVLAGVRLLEIHRHNLYKLNPKEKKVKKPGKKVLEEYKQEVVKLKEELEKLKKEAKGNKTYANARNQVSVVIQKTGETEKSIEELLDRSRTLAGLATIGISSAVFGHETQISISEFKLAASVAKDEIDDSPPDIESIRSELTKALKYADHVAAWGNFALTRVRRDKRTKEDINVKEVISKLVREIEPNFTATGISISSELDEVVAKVFVMDIETILLNFLTNAYSACLQKTSNRKVKIKLNESFNNGIPGLSIAVCDSGPGVDERNREIIWEEFYTTKVDEKGKEIGTGLGLPIVQSILEELDGTKSVNNDSELGGARFEVWLPK